MANPPAPALNLHVPVSECRLELNNWLQDRGWNSRFAWDDDKKDGPDHKPTWHVVCRCPFHFSPSLLDSYMWPTVDGIECGWGTDRTIDLAKEKAAHIALRRIILKEVTLPLIQRRQNQSASQPPASPPFHL